MLLQEDLFTNTFIITSQHRITVTRKITSHIFCASITHLLVKNSKENFETFLLLLTWKEIGVIKNLTQVLRASLTSRQKLQIKNLFWKIIYIFLIKYTHIYIQKRYILKNIQFCKRKFITRINKEIFKYSLFMI